MGNQLSFSVTESELNRVMVGKFGGVTVDPRGQADMIMLIIIASAYCFDVLAVVYMLWNRKYPPIKSKSPIIMAIMMAVSIIWFVGDLQSNGHVPLAGTPMTNCKPFGLWMRILLGVCSLCALTALRAYGLYRVFFLNLPYHSLGLYLPFTIYFLCLIVFGIVFQVLKPEITTMYIAELDLCNLHTLYKAILFTLLALTWLILVFIHWRIRSIKSSFNESREMLTNCVIIFACIIYAITLNYVRPQYPVNVYLRVITTSIDHVGTHLLWWLIMAVPLANCLFNRQPYLENWINKLRKDGLQKMYEFDPDTFVTNGRESLLLTNTIVGKTDGQYYPGQDSIYGDKDADSSYKSNLDYPMNS